MTELKVLSWNVLISNPRIEEVVGYIRSVDADLVCLQEVSDVLLEKLRELPYHLVEDVDCTFTTNAWHPEKGTTTAHVVILSKFPMQSSASIAFPPLPAGKRVHFFDNLLHLAGIWSGGVIRDKHAISADVLIEEKIVRVFSVHLALFTPSIRRTEFEIVMRHLAPSGINIVAGDFNILESFYIKVWNWMRGSRIREAMPWANERKGFEKVFAAAGLQNPLRGTVTHPISQSQLDHILVSDGVEVMQTEVSRKKHHSDHAPVQAIIRI